MRIFNSNWPTDDEMQGGPGAGDLPPLGAALDIFVNFVGAQIELRLVNVTVDLENVSQTVTFSFSNDAEEGVYQRISISVGDEQGPFAFPSPSTSAAMFLGVDYGDALVRINNGDQGKFQAFLEARVDGGEWVALNDVPMTGEPFFEVINPANAFLAFDEGTPGGNCFWTHNLIVIEDCDPPIPPTSWTGEGQNGFLGALSPNTIGVYSKAYDGYVTPAGFNVEGIAWNNSMYAMTMDWFSSEYGGAAYNYTGTYENLRIIKMDESNVVVDTIPIAGSFPVTVIGQDEGLRNYAFLASIVGTIPAYDSSFRWGFIADLELTNVIDVGATPVNVEISGAYCYDVKTLSIEAADQAECIFGGPSLIEGEYAGLGWSYTAFPPCDTTTPLPATYDGSPIIIPTHHSCT